MAGAASDSGVGIEASIETAEGLLRASDIVQASDRVRTLVFGIADYSASSIGARLVSISGHGEKEEELYPGHRWHFTLSNMVMHAKAFGRMAIDAPYGNFKDLDGLRRSVMASALGCDGKWAIHPAQIDIINEVSPTLAGGNRTGGQGHRGKRPGQGGGERCGGGGGADGVDQPRCGWPANSGNRRDT